MRFLIPILLFLFLSTGCTVPVKSDPRAAQTQLAAAWQQDWQGTWQLHWEQSPLAGTLLFAAWHTADGTRQRFEVLQAADPGWVGLVYVDDGQSARLCNQFDDTPAQTAPDLPFSPITDAFSLVDTWLKQVPQSAQRQQSSTGEQWFFRYAADRRLTVWLDTATNRITGIQLTADQLDLTLTAQSLEPLNLAQLLLPPCE